MWNPHDLQITASLQSQEISTRRVWTWPGNENLLYAKQSMQRFASIKKGCNVLCWDKLRGEEAKVGRAVFHTCLCSSFSIAIRLSGRRYVCWRLALIQSRCSGVSWGLSEVVDAMLTSLLLGWGAEFAWSKVEKVYWDEASKSSIDSVSADGDSSWGVDSREIARGGVKCEDWGGWWG